MNHLKPNGNYNFLRSREFSEAINAETSQLKPQQRQLCSNAAKEFVHDFGNRDVVLERLGDFDASNLYVTYPLENSKELSIVLAIEEYEDNDLNVCVLANAGIHSDMEQWAKIYYYSFDPVLAIPLNEEDEILDIAFQKDFEAWKFFLYPEQMRFAHRSWSGPAYIAGAAGTGKTVIGFHYVATLIDRYPDKKFLFVTKRSALLNQFEERFKRLRKDAANVHFIHIDDIAYNVIKEERKKKGMDWERLEDNGHALWRKRQTKIDVDFFEDSYERIVKGSTLENLGQQYLKDEIEKVIIGGGIASLEDYRCSKRRGRLRQFGVEALKLIWDFHMDWNSKVEQLDSDGCITRYIDRIVEAQNIVARNESQWRYRAAIIDEVQDMSLAEIKLVRSLVAGPEETPLLKDSMLILGDQAQQIFPGGFSRTDLKQINIDISDDRYHELHSNYRNAEAIYDAARRVRGMDCVTGEKADLSSVQTHLKGEGYKPHFIKVKPGSDKDFVGDKIDEVLREGCAESHHIGVLTRDREDAQRLVEYLEQERDHRCTLVLKGDVTGDGIRIGAFETTKGMEFRVVLIPYLARSRFPNLPLSNDASEIDPDEAKEARLLERGYLYAAMTRARDQLYLIADEEPCEEITEACECFVWIDRST